MGESVTDMEINTDRQVHVGSDNDLDTIDGRDAILQSAVIQAGGVLRNLVGGQLTAETFDEAETRLQQALQSDPQLENVRTVNITSVDQSAGTVDISVGVGVDETFVLEDMSV